MDNNFSSFEDQSGQPTLKDHLIEFFELLIVFAAIGSIIYWQIAQPHKVSGLSMYPNFNDGDYIITDKITQKFNEYKRGEIIVFKKKDKSDDYIKRVIGLPGDKIRISEGIVYLNNKALDEPYLKNNKYTQPGLYISENQELTLPKNNYFVLGDNRNVSSDSREWGFVTRDEIKGIVFFRYWPSEKIGFYPAQYEIKN